MVIVTGGKGGAKQKMASSWIRAQEPGMALQLQLSYCLISSYKWYRHYIKLMNETIIIRHIPVLLFSGTLKCSMNSWSGLYLLVWPSMENYNTEREKERKHIIHLHNILQRQASAGTVWLVWGPVKMQLYIATNVLADCSHLTDIWRPVKDGLTSIP